MGSAAKRIRAKVKRNDRNLVIAKNGRDYHGAFIRRIAAHTAHFQSGLLLHPRLHLRLVEAERLEAPHLNGLREAAKQCLFVERGKCRHQVAFLDASAQQLTQGLHALAACGTNQFPSVTKKKIT